MAIIAERAAARPRSRSRSAAATAPSIGVIYPSGWGNLGDEAILQCTFEMLRERWPQARIRAFTLHPGKTAVNHGVEAEPLTGVYRPLFGAFRDDEPFAVRAARSLARRTKRVPRLRNGTQWLAQWIATVFFETTSVRSAWRWLQTADLLLASGGGQLDAVWGGTMGQPYALARWAFLARRAGVPFAFLSVGYGGAQGRLSRWLLRFAVSRAAYCSVRDAGSRELTQRLGVARYLPVVPDLAFGLEVAPAARRHSAGLDVGLSPMTYLRPGSWPREDKAEYRRYVGLWAAVTSSLVAKGDRVHLFITDPGDTDALRDVWERLDESARAGTSIETAETPDALLNLFRRLDVVIASRLHGVLLAIVAARPVLGLSHERKVRAAMSDAGVSSFCLDLPSATLEQIAERLEVLRSDLDSCRERLVEYGRAARTAVRKQNEMLPRLLRLR